MSKDIRKMIDKVKNFKQFVNENKYYDEDDDEYYDLLNINISDLILSKRSLLGVLNNFIDNKKSQSNDKPLMVWKNDNNKFFLVDGYHRVFDFLLNNNLSHNVIISGEGYSDYYDEPKNDNIFLVDINQKYNGLENIISTKILDSLKS